MTTITFGMYAEGLEGSLEASKGFEFANWHKYYYENSGLSALW